MSHIPASLEDYTMLSIHDTAETMAAQTIANRGGTFTMDGQPVNATSGYAVAIRRHGKGNGALLSLAYLTERLCRILVDGGRDGDLYIGTWVEANHVGNDVAYIDRVTILPDRESALILATALHEQAIWDFAAGESIYTKWGRGLAQDIVDAA